MQIKQVAKGLKEPTEICELKFKQATKLINPEKSYEMEAYYDRSRCEYSTQIDVLL